MKSPGTLAPPGTEPAARAPSGRAGAGNRGGSPNASAVRDRTDAPPARADGVELLGEFAGSGYRRPPSLVRRVDGQMMQLTPLVYRVLEAIDGHRTHSQIAALVGERIARIVTPDDIQYLIETKLRPLGLLRQADGSEPAVKKANPLLALRGRIVMSNPNVTRRIVAPFTKSFLPQVVVVMLVAFALASVWVLMDKGLASAAHQALYEPGLLLLIFGLTILSAAFHEFGHAAACRYGGARPGAMGFGLYLIWPAFYTEVSDSYRLGRGGRLRVDLGGLYFNAIFAVAVFGMWAATGWDALLLIMPAQLLQMLRQLVPVVRFDGYHVLADLTGVPDLFSHIKPILLGMLPTRWGRPEGKVLKPWVKAVVSLWVLIVIPVLALSLVLIVKVLPRLAATAWDSLGLQWGVLQGNWADGDVAGGGVRLLSILTIALPVLSMSYLLARIARRASLRLWRATEGRPARRATAVLAAAAGLTLLAWAWWPEGQYRPIQPHERGTLLDGIGAAEPSDDGLPTSSQGRRPNAAPGTQTIATGVFPPSPAVLSGVQSLPQSDLELSPGTPESAVTAGLPPATVLDPDTAETGWVFPFNPPSEPTAGDNQALAINTEDGASVYEIAFALLWLTEGPVDQSNEAWALASCSDCVTVAVAFQAIFVIGQADVVIPQNIAVAINYACEECHTYALAVQLVATLVNSPSEEAMNELALVWEELEELGRNIENIPLEQLHVELAAIEAAILEILVQDAGAVPLDGEAAQDAIGDSPETEATDDDGTDTTAESDSTTSDDGSTTSDGSETTATDETTDEESTDESTTEEPSPTPSPTP